MKKSPLTILVIAGLLVTGLAVYRYARPPVDGPSAQAPSHGRPWQIQVEPDGTSRVFGVSLGHGTLREAVTRFGPLTEIAVIARRGEPGSLEAYYADASAGGITGKLVFGADADPRTLEHLKANAAKTEHMASGARKYRVSVEDLDSALALPLGTITFIPSASFDEHTAVARFGQPAARIPTEAGVVHLLYPEKGLDIRLNARGKEVLQYVAPRDFERLRRPLLKARHKPDPGN